MTIVLNENDWAEDMIKAQSLGKKPFETLCRVARYYIDKGISKSKTRKLLDTFLLQCEPTASIPKWADTLDAALSRALKYEAVAIESIDITSPEMKRIDVLNGKQIRRLAFTLLCLSKYWDAVNPNTNHWVNNKDSDIMRLANINTSIKRQSAMYHELQQNGMLQFSRKVDNTSVRVLFAQQGDCVMKITDFRNLGYQYLRYHGEPYFECSNCGITTKYTNPEKGRRQKYCKACAVEVATQQSVNSIMRMRSTKRSRDKRYIVYEHVFPDGMVYIGLTGQQLKDRWKNGFGYSGTQAGEAILDYGWENIRHYILFESASKKDAEAAAHYAIQQIDNERPGRRYNGASGYAHASQSPVTPELSHVEVDGYGTISS